MKTNLISALIFFAASICGYSQVWQQTASTPEGSGVTEMVVRQINGYIFVTTGSFNWPNGDMGGVRRSTDDGVTWETTDTISSDTENNGLAVGNLVWRLNCTAFTSGTIAGRLEQ